MDGSWPAQRRIQQAFKSAMHGKAFAVQQQQCQLADPAPAHLASW
jgi:hypothetical protein